MLSSGCDVVIALMNSQQLEFPARDLQRIGPFNVWPWTEKGTHRLPFPKALEMTDSC